jgi:hypothetical protein
MRLSNKTALIKSGCSRIGLARAERSGRSGRPLVARTFAPLHLMQRSLGLAGDAAGAGAAASHTFDSSIRAPVLRALGGAF